MSFLPTCAATASSLIQQQHNGEGHDGGPSDDAQLAEGSRPVAPLATISSASAVAARTSALDPRAAVTENNATGAGGGGLSEALLPSTSSGTEADASAAASSTTAAHIRREQWTVADHRAAAAAAVRAERTGTIN
eukprot:COSAG06_NODE_13972_length_1201_cov_1.095281_1_plen_135_part_00